LKDDTLSPSRAYALWAADPGAFAGEARARARAAFIDTIACLVPGAFEPASRRARAGAEDWGDGRCTVVGEARARPAPVAALLNGTAAHALDFDDNFDPAKAHVSAVLVPALLALAEARGASGADAVEAYVVGVEIAARVGQGLNPVHRNRGWHATATVGTLAAAAACGRLARLDAARMAHALNLSTSFAGGFMSQFGTMAKPLHAGLAAEGGLRAAQLAGAGLTAGEETLDAEKGMNRLMVGPDLEARRAEVADGAEHGQTLRFETRAIGDPPAILRYGLKVKPYPACASTHRAIDGLLSLMQAHRFGPSDVAEIAVRLPASHLANLMYDDPADPMQAKFSLPYCLAVSLRRGGVGLADFSPEAVADPATRALMARVRSEPVDALETAFPTEIAVTLDSGARFETAIDAPKGRADNPLTEAELRAKLAACVDGLMPRDDAAALAEALDEFDSAAPAGRILALCNRARPV